MYFKTLWHIVFFENKIYLLTVLTALTALLSGYISVKYKNNVKIVEEYIK